MAPLLAVTAITVGSSMGAAAISSSAQSKAAKSAENLARDQQAQALTEQKRLEEKYGLTSGELQRETYLFGEEGDTRPIAQDYKSSFESKINQQQQDFQTKINQQRQQFERDIASQTTARSGDVSWLEQDIDKQRQQFESDLAAQRQQAGKFEAGGEFAGNTPEQLEVMLRKERQQFENKVGKERQESEQKMQRPLSSERERELTKEREALESAQAAKRQRFEQKTGEFSEEKKGATPEQITALEQDIERQRQAFESDIASQRQQFTVAGEATPEQFEQDLRQQQEAFELNLAEQQRSFDENITKQQADFQADFESKETSGYFKTTGLERRRGTEIERRAGLTGEELLRETGPLTRELLDTISGRLGRPAEELYKTEGGLPAEQYYKAITSGKPLDTFDAELQLAVQAAAQKAAGRGIYSQAIPGDIGLEAMGRAGVEAAIAASKDRLDRQAQLSTMLLNLTAGTRAEAGTVAERAVTTEEVARKEMAQYLQDLQIQTANAKRREAGVALGAAEIMQPQVAQSYQNLIGIEGYKGGIVGPAEAGLSALSQIGASILGASISGGLKQPSTLEQARTGGQDYSSVGNIQDISGRSLFDMYADEKRRRLY